MPSQILAQKTIGITASRRAGEQAAAFERHGARVVLAPTVRIVKTDDDAALGIETERVLQKPPEMVLVTTGHGFKSWVEFSEKQDIAEQVGDILADAVILVRGPKGRGAVRALGYADQGIAEVETTESLVDLAISRGVQGKTVLIQQHGNPDQHLIRRLEARGAQVVQVRPNRWVAPEQPELVDQLVESLVAGQIDVLTFTAAPAVAALLERAQELQQFSALVEVLKRRTKVAVVGPVTAEPLRALGVSAIVPERFRMGAMVKAVLAEFEPMSSDTVYL
ncbi:MAG: uroporphyrinogen-III synthase [Rothia sp. (in: high G+C Gram-positive bacteria)]|nr:uroporphyrinogen-III synthase [Rothia sp. (in: high G+C Gram-positive bacteria)]